jgi:aldehyde:ferredoxin oxidoreductase
LKQVTYADIVNYLAYNIYRNMNQMEAPMYGWAGNILRVDLGKKRVSHISTEAYCRDFIGGLGIAQKIYWDEGHPDKDAFHPDNPLIFMTGPLAATSAPAAPRWIVCGKSPLMHPETFYSGSMSGFFGAELKMAGFDGIVITGKAEKPIYLSIQDGKVEIKNARHLWGLKNSETRERLKIEEGDKAKLLSIGPGAENGSRIGTILTEVAGSGSRGFGSVMGAKNLKAIAVSGTGTIAVADAASIQRIRGRIKEMTGPGYFNLYGNPISLPGSMVVKKVHCHGCPMGCWRTLHRSPAGNEDIRKCQTPLFYSMWDRKLHGTVTEASFIATTMANDYSFCVLEIVFLLLWLEKCYEQKILSEKQTGLPLDMMGSLEFLESVFKKISSRDGFGEVLSEGVSRAAQRMGRQSEEIAVSQRAFPYGPKTFTQSALIYAVEPRPMITELHEVCEPLTKWALWHLSGGEKSYVSTEVLRKIGRQFWGSEKAVDFSTYEGKALAAIKIQHREFAKESMILCDFVWPIFDDAATAEHVGDPTLESQLLSAVTGKQINAEELERYGERIFNLNRAILLREGKKGRADDSLPETQYVERVEMIADVFGMHNPELLLPGAGDEIISRKGKAVDREKFERMLDEYYDLRGWDRAHGFPTKEKLQELGLGCVIEGMQGKII